jgi:hypothetical protein
MQATESLYHRQGEDCGDIPVGLDLGSGDWDRDDQQVVMTGGKGKGDGLDEREGMFSYVDERKYSLLTA